MLVIPASMARKMDSRRYNLKGTVFLSNDDDDDEGEREGGILVVVQVVVGTSKTSFSMLLLRFRLVNLFSTNK